MRFRWGAARDYQDVTGEDLIRLERERARTIHERWVHRPQFVGVMALGVIGFSCVVGAVLVVLLTKKGTDFATAVSVLGSVAAAAVGGIAGMLTGRGQSQPHHATPSTSAEAELHGGQPDGCGEGPEE